MSVATFSKLKIIKYYLRNTMMQPWSCDLAMMSIEKELVNSFDYVITVDYITIEDVIKIFSKTKPKNIIVW